MITELLGDDQAAALTEGIVNSLRGRSLSGEVRIELFLTASELSAAEYLTAIRQQLDHANPGEFVVDIPGLLKLDATLFSSGTIVSAPAEWQARMAAIKAPDARAYGNALAKSSSAVDPITILMTGPRRSGGQLLNHLWERKFKKAAEQCTGTRGAAIVIEWEGFDDATAFVESEGIQALLARTFDEHRHIAAIVLRCDTSPMRLGRMLNYATPAYIARSGVTEYPAVAQLIQFG
ncbi:MAG: hypothetical protein BGP25_02920 [Lysobacterales bacterium 63-13]|nr:MAG: hypothetical protein BGP25_02920 [Xanthomonadales bacterium 63-13]